MRGWPTSACVPARGRRHWRWHGVRSEPKLEVLDPHRRALGRLLRAGPRPRIAGARGHRAGLHFGNGRRELPARGRRGAPCSGAARGAHRRPTARAARLRSWDRPSTRPGSSAPPRALVLRGRREPRRRILHFASRHRAREPLAVAESLGRRRVATGRTGPPEPGRLREPLAAGARAPKIERTALAKPLRTPRVATAVPSREVRPLRERSLSRRRPGLSSPHRIHEQRRWIVIVSPVRPGRRVRRSARR